MGYGLVLAALATVSFLSGCGPSFQVSSVLNSASQAVPGAVIPNASPKNPFVCRAGSLPTPNELHRLSKPEYVNTIRDLMSGQVTTNDFATDLGTFPDEAGGVFNPFDRGATGLNDGIVKAHFAVAKKVATIVSSNAAKLAALWGDGCHTAATVTDACVTGFIDRFGLRAFRRPVKTEEKTPLLAAYRLGASASERAQLLLQAILMSPSVLYHTEMEGDFVDGRTDLVKLTSYEMASRLSYMIIGSTPDAQLLTAAANGALATEVGIGTEVARLFALPAARVTIQRFFSQWMGLDTVRTASYTPAFKAGIDTNGLAEEAVTELLTFADYIVTSKGSYKDLLLSRTAFVKSDRLAGIYGITRSADPTGRVELPAEERAGLLTRAAALFSGVDTTSPIHRGATIRRGLLCDEIPSPDPTKLPPGSLETPKYDPSLTTRQRFEQKTASAVCMGCHTSINPLGFALEDYDALGRFRTRERVLATDGTVAAELPLDTKVVANIAALNETPVVGALELSKAVASSGKFPACFSKKFYQFAFRQAPKTDDECVLAQMYDSLEKDNGSVNDMMKAIITSKSFQMRRLPGGTP